ncbi:MAG: DUF3102 domain-containing protein [Celeribacter sp.]|jgi:DNA repair exonuclease SbcCD ATPase subunit
MSEVTLFDYGQISEQANEVRAAAERIRLRMKRTAEDILSIGAELADVKEKMPHGSFGIWISAEFGMTIRTAQNLMQVHERYGKCETVSHLPPAALYALAAPSVPEEVRAEVHSRAAAGETVSAAEIKRLKREHAAAIEAANNRASQAQQERDTYRQRADSLADGQKALIEEERQKAQAAAKAAVEDELQAAIDAAESAQRQLDNERGRLEAAAAEAERLAKQKAQAEADNLAQAAMAEIQGKLNAAKAEERRLRDTKGRLSQNIERMKESVEKHQASLRDMRNADVEAAAIRNTMTGVIQSITLAMAEIHDIEHAHGEEVSGSMMRAASVCRQFADALEAFTQDAGKSGPTMRVVGGTGPSL